MKVCLSCSTAYADAPQCPHCESTESAEEWEMAKISQAGGPSYGPTGDVEETPEIAEETKVTVESEAPVEEPTEEPVLLAEVVPDGTVDEVITWTEADTNPPARLLAALDAERARPTPRVTLVGEVERRLAQF